MCGEKIERYYRGGTSLGSPPRVRGKDSGEWGKVRKIGITPACAGKSPWHRYSYAFT